VTEAQAGELLGHLDRLADSLETLASLAALVRTEWGQALGYLVALGAQAFALAIGVLIAYTLWKLVGELVVSFFPGPHTR
jgi:hypothetical protein